MKLTAMLLIAAQAAIGAGEDAQVLLDKARTAFLDNRDRERYWNWTIITRRSILDKHGKLIVELPSITVESPIRSDGKRCNALLAWGDGREPYLAKASADERCTVEQELKELFQEENLLASRLVKLQSRSASEIALEIPVDKALTKSKDPFQRCTASVKATLHLDAATYFPKRIAMEVVGSGCEQVRGVVNHYDNAAPLTNARSTLTKGATLEREYVLQKDKGGDTTKNFWMCMHQHSVRPLRDSATLLLVWGRSFEIGEPVSGRHVEVDALTIANELASESLLKFDTQTKKND